MWCTGSQERKGGEDRWRNPSRLAGNKQIDEDGYRYLGILELDRVKEEEMKIQCQKEYKRRLKMVPK